MPKKYRSKIKGYILPYIYVDNKLLLLVAMERLKEPGEYYCSLLGGTSKNLREIKDSTVRELYEETRGYMQIEKSNLLEYITLNDKDKCTMYLLPLLNNNRIINDINSFKNGILMPPECAESSFVIALTIDDLLTWSLNKSISSEPYYYFRKPFINKYPVSNYKKFMQYFKGGTKQVSENETDNNNNNDMNDDMNDELNFFNRNKRNKVSYDGLKKPVIIYTHHNSGSGSGSGSSSDRGRSRGRGRNSDIDSDICIGSDENNNDNGVNKSSNSNDSSSDSDSNSDDIKLVNDSKNRELKVWVSDRLLYLINNLDENNLRKLHEKHGIFYRYNNNKTIKNVNNVNNSINNNKQMFRLHSI